MVKNPQRQYAESTQRVEFTEVLTEGEANFLADTCFGFVFKGYDWESGLIANIY